MVTFYGQNFANCLVTQTNSDYAVYVPISGIILTGVPDIERDMG